MSHKPTNQKGASVIEVLLSIGLTAILIASVSSSLGAVHRLNAASKTKEKAVVYAEQAMEMITEFKNNPANNFSDPIPDCNATTCPNNSSLDNGYVCTCAISSPDPDRQKITVTIQYEGQEKISLATLFTKWRTP